jgi:NAD(P)-dependent dehydrogenase (short-subunit alcohol dehydrogenase family)
MGEVVLVTGSSGPVGSVLCEKLISRGYRVIGLDLSEPKQIQPTKFVKVDLAETAVLREAIADVLKEFPINHIVNNAAVTPERAGPGFSSQFDEQSDEAFRAAMEVNLLAPFAIVSEVVRREKSSLKSIVNLGSTYGMVGPNLSIYEGTSMGNSVAYAATKGGIIQLSRYLATVLSPNIRVNSVSPGGIYRNHPESFASNYSRLTPLGRMNTELETVNAIMFLISDESSYITGQNLAVDGGWTAW